MFAAGPFATNKALTYKPLKDLLERAKEEKPNVLILQGPFIDH